jgi:hypothetical protein
VLAVIFGAIARRRARQGGLDSRLGTAGLPLGLVGLLLTGALNVALRVHSANTHVTRHAPPAQVIALQPHATELTRIAAVTVYTLTYPLTPTDPRATVPAGYEFALADVSECAGSAGSPFPTDPSNFAVVLSGAPHTASGGLVDFIRAPALSGIDSLSPNQCVRGYVSFVIPSGSRPTAVRYTPLLGKYDRYQWDVAG